MSRVFDGTNTHALAKGSAVATAAPLTMAGWINMSASLITQDILQFSSSAGGADFFNLYVDAGPPVNGGGVSRQSANFAGVVASLTMVNATWYHVCIVWTDNANYTAYVNGGNAVAKTAQSPTVTPAGINNAWIGRSQGTGNECTASIGPVATWNVALTAADILELSLGLSPKKKKPGNLISYVWLAAGASPEHDLVTSTTWTLTGTPAVGAHPRTFAP